MVDPGQFQQLILNLAVKPPDRGSGLGLSTVYAIAKQSGGEVSLSSRLDENIIVRVWMSATTVTHCA